MATLGRALRLGLPLAGGALAYYVYSLSAVRRFENLDPEAAGAPGAMLDVDGFRVHHVDAGAGEPVVLIHGWNGSTFSFRYTVPELVRAGYRVVAIDLKGHGFSARTPGADYSLTAQAELVRGVMDRLGIERTAVVGHSMGGAVAMRLALGHPDRVTRLVLVDSVTVRELRRGVRAGRLLRPFLPLAVPFTMCREGFRLAALRSVAHDPAHATPEVAEGYFRPLRMKGHLRALGEQLRDRAGDPLLDPAGIGQPTLVLWGEHDRWLPPSNGEALARTIPMAELVIVRAAGHLPLEEQPASCNRAISAFLSAQRPAAGEAAVAARAEAPSA